MKIFNRGIIFILAISLLVLLLLIFILSDSPARAMFFFFLGPFRNLFNFGNMLNAAVPLIFGALAIIIAIKTGNLNLGGEGQIYSGAFVTTLAALALSPLGFFGAVIAVLAGAFSAGALAAFSGFFKAMWKTNELITTFLLSCAVIPVINYFVSVPFLDPQTSLI